MQGPLFRPGEILLRYAILYGLGGDPFAYNYFQILFLALTAIAALSLVPCRNFTDAGAGTVALSFLFGHHAYVAVMEANITISNGVVLLMMLLVLHLLQSKGSLGAQIGAAALSLVAVLTKEVGLIVPVALASGRNGR